MWRDTPWFFLLRILSVNEGRHAVSRQPWQAFFKLIYNVLVRTVSVMSCREREAHMWYTWRTASRPDQASERSVPCVVIWPLWSLSCGQILGNFSPLPPYPPDCLTLLPLSLSLCPSSSLIIHFLWWRGLIRNNFPLIEWKYHEASDDKTAGRKRSSKIRSLYFLWEFLNVFLGFIQSRCSKT